MKLSPSLVVALLPLLACDSPPGRTDSVSTDRPSLVVTPPLPAAPTSRLVALTPAGSLCVLDAATGAVLSTADAAALDLAADQDHPDTLATLEPARDEEPGQLARHRLRGDHLERTGSLPFDASEGRLLRAGDALVGVAQTEMTTLFWARQEQGAGKVWGPVRAAATIAEATGLRVQTAGLPDGPTVLLQMALVSERGVEQLVASEIDAPRGTALFAHRDGFGRVDSTPTGWRVIGGPHDGFRMDSPDSFPIEALMMGPGRLAVLTGPAAQLWVLSPWGTHAVTLGDEVLPEPERVSHRLAHDASRQRVWVVAGHTAYAIELPSLRIAATGACPASALAVITPEP